MHPNFILSSMRARLGPPHRLSVPALIVALTFVGACTGAAQPTATASPTSDTGAAAALQTDFVNVVRDVDPSVVVIETSKGLGSGVIFDSQGDIVTNAHVTDGSTRFTVTLADGRRAPGTLVGRFESGDLAVVHVAAQNLRPATFADSSKVVVGDVVLAVGNPLGLQSSVTEGIVSAVGRTVSEEGGNVLPNVIQTSAAINPGNSGGALVDLNGDVIGIPTLAATDPQLGGGAAPGIGFAIPSSIAADIANQLIKIGHVVDSHRAYLGVRVANVTGRVGVLVDSVQKGGPAANSGIARGDFITSVDGRATSSASALATVLADLAPDQSVRVSFTRPNGTKATVEVMLGELPG